MIIEKTTELKAFNRFIEIGHALLRFQAMVHFTVQRVQPNHRYVYIFVFQWEQDLLSSLLSTACYSNCRSNGGKRVKMNKQLKIELMLLHCDRLNGFNESIHKTLLRVKISQTPNWSGDVLWLFSKLSYRNKSVADEEKSLPNLWLGY